MTGVGGGGRRKLSCERGQLMGYRTQLALVGKGRHGPRAHAHWMGRAIARSITRRARPRQTRRRSERSNGRTSGSPPRAPPTRTAPSTAGKRTAHLWPVLSLRPSQMAAGKIHNIWKCNSAALAYGHAAFDIHGNGVCKDSARKPVNTG